MAIRKTTTLLPEVFRTSKNEKFLNATLDQLVSEEDKIKVSGFIGRKNAENFRKGDGYIIESNSFRQNYQLEPGVVYEDAGGTIQSIGSISDTLNTLRYNNATVTNQDRLFRQDYYNWSSFVDYDKLINYGEYFWLPSGPDTVQVFGGVVDTTQTYSVLREENGGTNYRFDSSTSTPNPILYFARGGEYTFTVDQTGNPFWIQSELGTTGISASQLNISTREVPGITNNGEDVGTITWRVPSSDSQSRFTNMVTEYNVDLATDLPYKDLQNQLLTTFLATNITGIDGLTEINGKTLVFASTSLDERDWKPSSISAGNSYRTVDNAVLTADNEYSNTTLTTTERYGVFSINVKSVGGQDTITLDRLHDVTKYNKLKIKQGTTYGSRYLYKNAEEQLELVPAIVASQEEFYYQDGLDTGRFGKIILVEQATTASINVIEQIIDQVSYTSPNGVVFTNGLKIELDTSASPVSYQNNVYYVEGVGTGIKLVLEDDLITPEPYAVTATERFDSKNYDVGGFEQTLNSPTTHDYILLNRASADNNAWSRGNRWFHRSVITATATYNNFTTVIDDDSRAKRPIIEFEEGLKLYNMGTTSKSPVSIVDTVETDAFSNVNGKQGYYADGINLTPGLTICFTADPDINKNIYRVDFIDVNVTGNSSNRRADSTFTIDIGSVTADDSPFESINDLINLVLIDTVVDGDSLLSKLGSANQGNMYYYTLSTNIWAVGQQKTGVNQEPLFDIYDPAHISFSDATKYPSTDFVGNKLFSYKKSTTTSSADSILGFGLTYRNIQNVGDIVFDNNFVNDTFTYTKENTGQVSVILRSGHVHSFSVDTTNTITRKTLNGWTKILNPSRQWQQVQYTVDAELYTFEIGSQPVTTGGEVTLQVYVNGIFQTGSKYTQTTVNDKYYANFTDKLVKDDVVLIRVYSTTINPLGFYEIASNLENNSNNDDFANLTLGQLRNHFVDISRAIPTFTGSSLGNNNIRDLQYKKYPGKILQHSAGSVLPNYMLTQSDNSYIESIRFSMEEYTRFKSRLLDNIDNLDIDLTDPSGSLDTILIFMAGTKTNDFPFYYSDMLPWGSQKTTTTLILDQITNRVFEFTTQFDLTNLSNRGVLVYLTESSGAKTQLIEESDYTFDTVEPAITLDANVSISVGDILSIVEYSNTDGIFVPPTPTKLGLYPKFEPAVTLDDTYISGTSTGTGPFKIYGTADSRVTQRGQSKTGWFYPLYTTLAAAQSADSSSNAHIHRFVGSDRAWYMASSETQYHASNDTEQYNEYLDYTPVLLGHDGSRWICYKDKRDLIVLEYEKRIYNNIKTQYEATRFDLSEVTPGYFRTTRADLDETTLLYSQYFSTWAYKNALDFSSITSHSQANTFTWNYSGSVLKGTTTLLPGSWRAIYKWLYDTETPHLTPWEMLGVFQKPSWWETRYGAAPYTRGNNVLWNDLAAGKLYTSADRDATFTIVTSRIRSGLLNLIPVDDQGKLLSPAQFAVEGAFSTNTNNSWRIGDVGPVETAWTRSSEYPFSQQIVSALKRPAKYLTLLWDTNLLENNTDYDQIVQKTKSYRPKTADFKINGLLTSGGVNRIEGYNQFIADYYKYKSLDLSGLQTQVQNLSLRLIYPVGGFTDLNLAKFVIESTSPGSTQSNTFIPDENVSIYLNKSTPIERVFYSGISIVKRAAGYEIRGYDTKNPFFKIIPSQKSQNTKLISVGDVSAVVYGDSATYIANIPYGTIIPTIQQTADFLISYSRYLKAKGILFEDVDNAGVTVDFENTVKEFIFWTQQGWGNDSVFGASPNYRKLKVTRPFTTLDDLSKSGTLKNSSGRAIRSTNYNVERIDNTTVIEVNDSSDYLYSAQIDPIQYEHYIVLDNTTIFNDIIYQPELGNRQSRIKFVGYKSGTWNGTLHAPGFIINENKFNVWLQNTDYKKADIVSHNKKLYVARDNHNGKSTFDFNDWRPVENMKTGLLPNLSQKSKRFTDFYDFNTTNLESGTDIAAKGQIGFRKRDYLDQLGLDDTSQVKFYQGMIKTKGTANAIDKLIGANLSNLDQEISFYEDWGFRVGEYGSIDSNQVIEMVIDESKVQQSKTVVELVDNNDSANTDYYSFTKSDLYKLPNNFTKNIFLERSTSNKKTDILGAGYPRLDEVTTTLFGLDNISTLNDLPNIGRGSTIWTAEEDFDWNVYRVTELAISITNIAVGTDTSAIITTSGNHGLVKNDYILIKASTVVGGFHKVTNVITNVSFTVDLDDVEIDNIVDLRLPVFKLVSSRFNSQSDIADNVPLYGWDLNESVWVNYDEKGKWATYKKQEPWTYKNITFNIDSVASDLNGTSLSISNDALNIASGAPEHSTGAVYPYSRDENGIYNPGAALAPATLQSDVDTFGWKVAAGNSWLAVGAPDSDSAKGEVFIYLRAASTGIYEFKQILRLPSPAGADKFGYSIAMSKDDRYMYIGAPGANKVFSYTLTNIATTDNISKTITGNGSTTTFALGFTPTSLTSLQVIDAAGKIYVPTKDYGFSSTNIVFVTAPANTLSVVVRQESHYILTDTITGTGVQTGDQFGYDVDCDTAGDTLIVGSPFAEVEEITDAGEAFLFHHVVEKFIGDGTTYEFTPTTTLPASFFIEVDSVLQLVTEGAFSSFTSDSSENNFTFSGNTISFRYIPSVGQIIRIYTGSIVEIQKLNQEQISTETQTDNEQFGISVALDAYGAIAAVGCPGEDELNPNTGSVFMFIDEGLRFGSVTSQNLNTSSTEGYMASNSVIKADSSTVTTDSFLTLFAAQGDIITIDDIKVTVVLNDNSDATNFVADINNANVQTVTATASGTLNMTITGSAGVVNKKLKVRPMTGDTFKDYARFEPFKFTQKVSHPLKAENENFGKVVEFDKFLPADQIVEQRMVVTSDRASTQFKTAFDLDIDTTSNTYNEHLTTFDSDSTKFMDKVTNSGAAYVYELLDSSVYSANIQSISNPPKYAYGQQMQNTSINANDQFGGSAVLHGTRLFVGSPTDDIWKTNAGSFYLFQNIDNLSTWKKNSTEDNKVDVDVINRVATYSKVNNTIIDFIDTVDIYKNKLPGQAQQELNYIIPIDPATYNVSTTPNSVTFSQTNGWNDEHIAEVWWDLSTCRVLEYEQGEISYRVQYWNQFFPGSSVDIYEWYESDVLPSLHVSSGLNGVPKFADDSNYSTSLQYNSGTNSTETRYYYWVTGLTDFIDNEIRTLSTESVRQLIETPDSTGTKYLSIVAPNTFVMNNMTSSFADRNVVLSINYDVVRNDGILHSEFEIISEGDSDQILPAKIKSKMIDSLSGADLSGKIVPDPTLSVGEKYGISIRPRQTIFENRQQALKTFVDYCNVVFATVPITRQFSLNNLFLNDPLPTKASGAWDSKVADVITRDYLNTATLAIGYKILVESDSTIGGDWSTYELRSTTAGVRFWFLSTVQAYNTSRYWQYTTWYATGFSSTTLPTATVATEPDLQRLTGAVTGDIVKVNSNDDGNFSIYQYTSTDTWNEIIIERGTVVLLGNLYDFANASTGSYIGFDTGVFDFEKYDRVPHQEVRNIANAVFNDIFVNTLAKKGNELFFRMVEYSLQELNSSVPDWVIKTSFLKILHKVRDLSQYPTYQVDNTTFIEEFINEVKPYHTNIREYTAKYDGDDTMQGDITDFDLHSFYDPTNGYFRKYSGDFAGDTTSRTTGTTVDKSWADNYTYYLGSVEIYAAGTGYTDNPVVTVSAPDISTGTQATVTATSDSNSIIRVTITNKGIGYTSTPTLTISGSGTGLVLLPRIKNDTIRDFDTTIKFDRITYSSAVKDWSASTTYSPSGLASNTSQTADSGISLTAPQVTLVSYLNIITNTQDVYEVILGFTSGTTFSTEDASGNIVLSLYADESIGSAADRIAAYYSPTSGMLGDDLGILQKGTNYTANKLSGVDFNREPGYDSANFDNVAFDDFEVDNDGLTVLGGSSAYDTVLQSKFLDTSLGTRPEDINIDGGGFIDIYSSHAPEEFVPGQIFDNLDMEVYTDPNNDEAGDGSGCTIVSKHYTANGTDTTFSFAGTSRSELVNYVVVYIGNKRQYNFTTDFNARTITFTTTHADSEIVTSDSSLITITADSTNAPLLGDKVHTYGYGVTGENLVHEELFTGDAVTTILNLNIELSLVKQSLVLIDNVALSLDSNEYTLTADSQSRTVLTFATAPATDTVIHVLFSSDATDKNVFGFGITQTITLTSGQALYGLDNSFTGFSKPYEANCIVELNGHRLRPTNAEHYILDGVQTEFRIPTTANETTQNTSVGDIQITVIDIATSVSIGLLNVQDYNLSTLSSDFSTITVDDITETADNSETFRVTLLDSRNSGDRMIIAVTNANEFSITDAPQPYFDTGYVDQVDGINNYVSDLLTSIVLNNVAFNTGDQLVVTSFQNYDPLRIQTKVFIGPNLSNSSDSFVVTADSSGRVDTLNTADLLYALDRFQTTGITADMVTTVRDGKLSSGILLTTDSATVTVDNITVAPKQPNKDNLWVTLDGVRLHHDEYEVDDLGRIDLSSQDRESVLDIMSADSNTFTVDNTDASQRISPTAEVIVTHFTENSLEPTVGYRMINDMLGNYEYFRLSVDGATTITQDLVSTDKFIYVADATKLKLPSIESNEPGVVYVGNERITYWELSYEGNYLTQLRRATRGTRFASRHLLGENVYDTTDAQALPQTDTHTQTWYDNGVESVDQNILTADYLSVTNGTTILASTQNTPGDNNGIQTATSLNADFLRQAEAFIPNYSSEFQSPKYVLDDYVDTGYIADLEL